MPRKHFREAFYALDDPLEATVFSVLLELVKKMDKADHDRKTCGLIPPTECAI
jgi:hypothetical protein